jgi:hypothetical protein
MSPRVLLVGAYERDNLGDLLFLLVTERYLAGAEVVAAAPFGADMTALLDRHVPAYGPLLRRERFDAIWTAGGQVGAVDVRRAYRMSAPPRDYRRFLRGSDRRRAAILRRVTGGEPPLSPYIPSVRAHPLNADALRVLNSVGLSGIRRVDPHRRGQLIDLLRSQDVIAVRDRASSRLLTGLGIEHRLVPDAIHALAHVRRVERDQRPREAVVQVSSAILLRLGAERVAAHIARSRSLRGLALRLLPAGTATGHDSLAEYEELAAMIRRRAPWLGTRVVGERRPLDLVDRLARARVVIGTSLHVRIVAAAYGVPRLTLSRWKPTQYAHTWDAGMPFDVGIDELDAAVEAALAGARRGADAARTEELSRLAHEHLGDLAARVRAQRSRAGSSERSDRRDGLARAERAPVGAPGPRRADVS